MTEKASLSEFKSARFEKKVKMIFQKSYDNFEKEVLVQGKKSNKPHKVDLHAWKFKGLFESVRIDTWVKLSRKKVSKNIIENLHESIEDVREAKKARMIDWSPDNVFIASSEGFDSEALKLAKKYKIYCMRVFEDGFEFVGEMKPVSRWNILFNQILFFIASIIAVLILIYLVNLFLA